MAFTTTAVNPRISATYLDSLQVLQRRVRNGKAPSITVFTSCVLCPIQMLKSPPIFPQEKPRVPMPMLNP
jgi:hypothetical protein